jgi:hypothetical protein
MMQASYLGAMGHAQRYNFPTTWPIPPVYHDPETSVRSYQEGMEECQLAEEMGFAWIRFSEHHYSGRIATGTNHREVMQAIALFGQEVLPRLREF